jgi:ABC-2 type transport system permease protein
MFRVEIGTAVRRLRTYVFGLGLTGLAVLPVVVLSTSSSERGGGPVFFDQIRHNGLFATLAVIAILLPFFLPLGTSLLSGEAIAGEASTGTLRYLVVRPVGRTRLVLHKYAAVVAQVGAAIAWVMVAALVAGGIAFGFGRLPTLSGTTLGPGTSTVRIVAAGGYALCAMAGLAAVGLFLSTLTDSGIGAAVATMALAIGSQIVDGLPSLHAVHPYLFSHGWFAFVDLFRSPIEWSGILRGLTVDLAYVLVFLGAAVAVFARKDVVS